MLHKLSEKICQYYIDKNKIDKEKKEEYSFCFEILLSTIINLFVVVTMGIIAKMYLETICFVIAFMTLRGAVGGNHAKTHFGCLAILIIVFTGLIMFNKLLSIELQKILGIILISTGWLLIIIFAPVDNANKQFNFVEKKRYRKKSLITINLFVIPFVIMVMFNKTIEYSFTIAYSIFVVSMSVIAGMIQACIANKNTKIDIK